MVGDIRGIGLLRGVELVQDKETRKPFPRRLAVAETVVGEAASRGLLLVPGYGGVDGVDGDTVMLSPPFVLTEDDIDEIVEILRDSITAVAAAQAIAV